MERTKYRICGYCGKRTYKKPAWGGVICSSCWKKNTKVVVKKKGNGWLY